MSALPSARARVGRLAVSVLLAASALTVVLSTEPASADTGSAGQRAAAQYFLGAVCPANHANGVVYDAQTRAIGQGFTGRSGERIPDYMIGPLTRLGTSAVRASQLLGAYGRWPAKVRPEDLSEVRRSLEVDGRRATEMARRHAVPAGTAYDDWVYATQATERVRAALGLKGAGTGC